MPKALRERNRNVFPLAGTPINQLGIWGERQHIISSVIGVRRIKPGLKTSFDAFSALETHLVRAKQFEFCDISNFANGPRTAVVANSDTDFLKSFGFDFDFDF